MEPQDAFYIWHEDWVSADPEIEIGWGATEEDAANNSFMFPCAELEALIEFLEEQLTMQSRDTEEDAA